MYYTLFYMYKMLFVDEKICFATTYRMENREDRKPLILMVPDKLGKHGCSMSLPNLNTKRGLCGMP